MDGSTITQNVAKRAILKSLEASELQGHERLAELLCKWLVDEKWVPDLHYENFKPAAGVGTVELPAAPETTASAAPADLALAVGIVQ